MKKSIFLLFFLNTLMFLSCTKEDTAPEFALDIPDLLMAEEYEVYSSILEGYGQDQIIVRQLTSIYTPPKENFEMFFKLDRMANMESGLFSRYLNVNTNSFFLEEKIEAPAKNSKLISNSEYNYYFERVNINNGWELFNKKYPGAKSWYFSVNRVGFNVEKTQAIVGVESYWFMESTQGPNLKGAELYYLEKKNEKWEIIGRASYTL